MNDHLNRTCLDLLLNSSEKLGGEMEESSSLLTSSLRAGGWGNLVREAWRPLGSRTKLWPSLLDTALFSF